MNILDAYKLTILIIGLTGLVFLIQLLIVDLVGIKNKHQPGFPVKANHNDFHFRAERALANSNEGAAIFILMVLFSILSFADPDWLNIASGSYLIGRVGHMVCYYMNIKLIRSIFFGVSLLGLFGIFGVGLISWM